MEHSFLLATGAEKVGGDRRGFRRGNKDTRSVEEVRFVRRASPKKAEVRSERQKRFA